MDFVQPGKIQVRLQKRGNVIVREILLSVSTPPDYCRQRFPWGESLGTGRTRIVGGRWLASRQSYMWREGGLNTYGGL